MKLGGYAGVKRNPKRCRGFMRLGGYVRVKRNKKEVRDDEAWKLEVKQE